MFTMPFYQMLCITAHYNEYVSPSAVTRQLRLLTRRRQKPIKDLVQRTVHHLWDKGAVVRKLNSWGTKTLPQRMRRHKQYHQIGE